MDVEDDHSVRLYNMLRRSNWSVRSRDGLSFMRFLEGSRPPDAKTVWLKREQLTQAGAWIEAENSSVRHGWTWDQG